MNSCAHWLLALSMVAWFQCSFGLSCSPSDQRANITRCPSLCSVQNCSSYQLEQIEAFTEESETPAGCFTNGVLLPGGNGTMIYTERHIVHILNETAQNIYLTISEDSSSLIPQALANAGLRRIYHFLLLSRKPVNWIISLRQSDAKFYFHKNHPESTLQGSTEVSTIHIEKTLDAYNRRQITRKCCLKAFNIIDKTTCNLTSYLESNQADFIEMKVGVPKSSDHHYEPCEVPNEGTKIVEQQEIARSKVHIIALKSLSSRSACSSATSVFSTPNVIVVDLSGRIRNAVVKLHLANAYRLRHGEHKELVLLSSGNVRWQLFGVPGTEIGIDLKIHMSSGSSFDYDNLSFSNDGGSVRNATRPDIHSKGTGKLNEILHTYGNKENVMSYAKFTDTPDMVTISFLPADHIKQMEDKLHMDIIQIIKRGMTCSPTQMRVAISCEVFKEYGLNPNQLTFGNGACGFEVTSGGIFEWKLSNRCGLQPYKVKKLRINFTVGDGDPTPLQCQPTEIELAVYTDLQRNDKAKFPQNVLKENKGFYVEIDMIEPERKDYIATTHLEECYLVSQSTSTSCVHCSLIRNNCPVNKWSSIVLPYSIESNQQVFFFSTQPFWDDNVTGYYNLTCLVSKCISRHSSASYTTIPRCINERGFDCKPRKKGRFDYDMRELTVGSFQFSPSNGDQSVQRSGMLDTWVAAVLATISFLIGVAFIASIGWIKKHTRPVYNYVNSNTDSVESSGVEVRLPLANNHQDTEVQISNVHGLRRYRTTYLGKDSISSSQGASLSDLWRGLRKSHSRTKDRQLDPQADNQSADSGLPDQDSASLSTWSDSLVSSCESVNVRAKRSAFPAAGHDRG